MDYSYRAEYSKSARASCRSCKSTIAKDVLRIAALVQSPMFDGKMAQWYHFMCFFGKQRPQSVDQIEHFESLRYDDQQKIKEKIEQLGSAIVPTTSKGKGKGKKRDAPASGSTKDFTLEYAKSSRAICRGCEIKIMKEEVRISKKDYTSEIGMKYGGQDMWHHLSCFAKLRSELKFFAGGDQLPGFNSLNKADKAEVLKQLPAIKQEEPPVKKLKTEDAVDGKSEDNLEKQLKTQSDIMFKYRDRLKKHLNKQELYNLLEENNQAIPRGEEEALDRLSDIMTFGALLPCKECQDGQLIFDKVGYKCHGDKTEWAKCNAIVNEPARCAFKVPKEFAEEYSFLKKYKYVPRVRVFREVKVKPSTSGVKKEEDDADEYKPKVEREKPALYQMEFVILGKPPKGKDDLKKAIAKLGGKVVTKLLTHVMAVISTPEEVEKMNSRMSDAKALDIHVVPQEFVDEAPNYVGRIPELIIKKSICDWGSDPSKRLPAEPSNKSMLKSKSASIYTKSVPSKMTFKLKGGNAVDPDSGLEDVAHVYQSGDNKYNAVLGLTDIQRQKNSYYKLQLLAADSGNKYWLFRSWGRIGTTIGNNKVEKFSSLHEAKRAFEALYEEKSGNMWEDRHEFVKIPGKMYPIDVDYGEDEAKLDINEEIPSKLAKPVQNLVKMIFDINSMKKTMLEFELDMEKMPLGKLSKKQIQSAFKVLAELQDLVNNNASDHSYIDASNRFYTFIPHSFGIDDPPILNNQEIIKQKLDMLDSLMEIEVAYNLLKASGSGTGIDDHYETLKTEIDVLDHSSEEFKIIEEYVKNTHAATHTQYDLEVGDVFTIKRNGEEKRYKPFRKLHNRKLLWHGSRLTNYAGILSQGLRIAPPEAPVTGYMFGKGIYFADMVSKSANYCCTSPASSTGLMLLCEVALGDMHECKRADYIEKLPKGKHSCKGLGMTHPDPSGVRDLNGVEVPAGKGVKVSNLKSELLYNEYIVYDIAQVNIKYLLQMNFKYKY